MAEQIQDKLNAHKSLYCYALVVGGKRIKHYISSENAGKHFELIEKHFFKLAKFRIVVAGGWMPGVMYILTLTM